MVIRNDASLRATIRAIANKNALRPQEVLQMYLFEHLLLRLERSPYVDKFVLKGGLLISSMIGVAVRTTMDMDTTVVGMSMNRTNVECVMAEICSIDVGDEMNYIFEGVEPIRADDEYANWRAHLRVRFGRMNAPVKVDITTGDSIVPAQVDYRYPMMIDDGVISIMSYPLVTILAEKFETIVSRGVGNTRGRDFYDIYMFMKMRGGDIDYEEARRALEATVVKRGSETAVADYRNRLREVRESDVVRSAWDAYVQATPYAAGIAFDDAVSAALLLGDRIGAV